jgi:Sec-independent protein translocase protein TatA
MDDLGLPELILLSVITLIVFVPKLIRVLKK